MKSREIVYIVIILALVGFFIVPKFVNGNDGNTAIRDTVTTIDTTTHIDSKPIDSTQTGEQLRPNGTIIPKPLKRLKPKVNDDSVNIDPVLIEPCTDSVVRRPRTTEKELPSFDLVDYTYTDSVTYKAVFRAPSVYGYTPILKLMQTYNTTTTVNNMVYESQQPAFSFGIQGGYGYSFRNNNMTPYIGVGVQWYPFVKRKR